MMSPRSTLVPNAALAVTLVLAACGSPDPGTGDAGGADAGVVGPADFCTSGADLIYAPLDQSLDAFPDDFFTEDDAQSATGVRVAIIDGDNFDAPNGVGNFASAYADLSRVNGFGTTAAGFFRIAAAMDEDVLSTRNAGTADHPILFARIDGSTAEFVEFEVTQVVESGSDDAVTLVIAPARPLVPAGRYVLALKADAKTEEGGCVVPSTSMKQLLMGTATDAALTRLKPRYDDALAKLKAAGAIESEKSLSAAVVFTTQTTTEGATAAATDIRSRSFTVSEKSCSSADGVKQCEFSFTAGNYRKGSYFDESDVEPHSTYTIKASAWMPDEEHTEPWATMIAGHGLGGDRNQGAYLAAQAIQGGFAVVAIDAPYHGEHPNQPRLAQFGSAEFLGATLSGLSVRLDARKLRDNLATAAFDKLQLLELLKDGIDLDGDASIDVDAANLVYLGVSLGGIMAPEFLAYAPEVQVATPIVPGARMTDILRDSADFQSIVAQVRPPGMTDGMFARLLPVFQGVVERGDPAIFLPHVQKDRLAGFDTGKPQLLVQMVKDDTVVANSATKFYARAAGIPLLGDELVEIDFIQKVSGLPISDNIAPGLTGGLYQFDVLEDESPAEHSNLFSDRVSTAQIAQFLTSWFVDGEAEIIDSYRVLGVK